MKERKEKEEYIIWRQSPRRHQVHFLLSFIAVAEVKVRIQKERITCQYLLPLTGWVETDTFHVLVVFSPLKTIRELWLYLGL